MVGNTEAAEGYAGIVEAIYNTALESSRWPETLQRIADFFGDVGANLVYRRDDGSLGTIVSPGLEVAQKDYASGWWQQDIRFDRLIERGYLLTSDAFTDRHVVSDGEIETHPSMSASWQRMA